MDSITKRTRTRLSLKKKATANGNVEVFARRGIE